MLVLYQNQGFHQYVTNNEIKIHKSHNISFKIMVKWNVIRIPYQNIVYISNKYNS